MNARKLGRGDAETRELGRGDAETRRRGEKTPVGILFSPCPRVPASPRLSPFASPRLLHERGASVLPILLMLSFGIVDYGYFFYVKNTVQGAAQAGARAAIPASATNSNVTTLINNMMTAAGLQNSGYTVTLSPSDVSTASAGSSITVTVTVSWANVGLHALSASMGGISNSKQIVGTAVMRKESS